MNMSDDVKIVDLNGRPSYLTKFEVYIILLIGWMAFIFSNILNMIHYKVHPSEVDFNLKRFRTRLFIYVLGKRWELPGYVNDKVYEDQENIKMA